MTFRQLQVVDQWVADQWEIPSRSDFYDMQTAAEVRRGRVKDPRKVKLDDFRLGFRGTPKNKGLPLSIGAKAATKILQARAVGRVGGKVTEVRKPRAREGQVTPDA